MRLFIQVVAYLAIIALSSGVACAESDEVTVRLKDGRTVTLKSVLTEGESHIAYSLTSHLKDAGFYLITAHYYEGLGYVLVADESGDQTRIDKPPIFSKDGKHFVTCSYSISGYEPNRIGICEYKPHQSASCTYPLPEGNNGVINCIWESPTKATFDLARYHYGPEQGKYTCELERASLNLQADGWKVNRSNEVRSGTNKDCDI